MGAERETRITSDRSHSLVWENWKAIESETPFPCQRYIRSLIVDNALWVADGIDMVRKGWTLVAEAAGRGQIIEDPEAGPFSAYADMGEPIKGSPDPVTSCVQAIRAAVKEEERGLRCPPSHYVEWSSWNPVEAASAFPRQRYIERLCFNHVWWHRDRTDMVRDTEDTRAPGTATGEIQYKPSDIPVTISARTAAAVPGNPRASLECARVLQMALEKDLGMFSPDLPCGAFILHPDSPCIESQIEETVYEDGPLPANELATLGKELETDYLKTMGSALLQIGRDNFLYHGADLLRRWRQSVAFESARRGDFPFEVVPFKETEMARTSVRMFETSGQDLWEHITELLKDLPEREAKVIRMRFGIGYDHEHTLEEVGRAFAVTRERVRQIESKILRRLPNRSRHLRFFLEGTR